MEDRFLHHSAVYQMLDDDSLEQRRRDAGIPDTIGIHDDDGPAATHTETWCLPTFHPIGTEQQAVTLKQRRKELVQLASALVG